MTTSLVTDTDELRRISGLPTELALRQVTPVLTRLVKDSAFMESDIFSLLDEAQGAKDWYVARRYDDEDGAYSLQIFV